MGFDFSSGGIGAGIGSVFGPVGAVGGGLIGGMFGGGGDDEPKPPSMMDYARMTGEVAGQLQGTSEQIAPRQSQLQLDMLKQFGPQMQQARYDAANTIYPYTTQLQEQLAQQASEGIVAGLTENEARIVNDAIRGSLGAQATSGLGINRLSGSLLGETRARQAQYQQMGQQLTGRMPLFQAEIPQYTDYASQANFGQIAGLGMQQFNQQQAQQAQQGQGFSDLLGGIGSLAGMYFGGPVGGAIGGAAGSALGGGIGGGGSSIGNIGSAGFVPNSAYSSAPINFGGY